jgi:flagellar motility protein MotE (MotC chaperone)
MNRTCENIYKEGWMPWMTEDFDGFELKRQGCYTFVYDNPDCSDCAEKRIFVSKVCDRCFERYLTYKYENKAQTKEQEIERLTERLAKLERLLSIYA